MGFLHPWMFAFGALALPLVLLYILKVRREDRRVPAAWLWQASLREVEAQVPFRRLRRDWLLLLQLLALALLVVAAAQPFRRTLLAPGERTAVVLDASAGMFAADRFEEARRAARRLVDGMGGSDQTLLVRAGPRPLVLAPLTSDTRALHEALDGASPSPAPADLEGAVRFARRILGEGGLVVLLTDGTLPSPEVEGVRVVRVGEGASNTGITALATRPTDPSGASHEVFVRVENASNAPARGRVRILVDDRVRDAAALDVPAGETANRTLRLMGPREGLVEAVWEPDGENALSLDDRAGWILRAPAGRRYRFSGEREPWLARALASDPDWVEAAAGAPADLEIVVRSSPQPDGPPFLWVDPVELREEIVAGGAVLDWDRAHPALRFVDLHAVRLGRIPKIERPPGARVLAESTAGPMILEGSRGERPYLAWAFIPAETDLPLRAAFPLLVRNTLEHLAPESGGLPGGVPAGSAPEVHWPADAGEEVRLVDPDGRATILQPSAGRLRLPPLEKLGVWRLAGPGRELRFAVSLLAPEETDLRTLAEPAEDGSAQAAAATAGPRATLRGLWKPLALLALLLLVLESAAFFRRWTP